MTWWTSATSCTYKDEREACELAEWSTHDDDERRAIAGAGRAHVLATHTYAHRLRPLLSGSVYGLRSIGPRSTAYGLQATHLAPTVDRRP